MHSGVPRGGSEKAARRVALAAVRHGGGGTKIEVFQFTFFPASLGRAGPDPLRCAASLRCFERD